MSANMRAHLMSYESDYLFEIPADQASTLAILSAAYDLSDRPSLIQDQSSYIPGPIPHGTLNHLYLNNCRYQLGSIAFVLSTVHGRKVNFCIIRTNFRYSHHKQSPQILKHHIRKTWVDHTPTDVLKLVHQFAILEPLRLKHHHPILP